MSRSIEDMDTRVQVKARGLLAAIQATGIPHTVMSTRRTVEEQLALFAQYRAEFLLVQALRVHAGLKPLSEAENKYTVTKADGVFQRSKHQDGLALDIVPVDEKGQPTWDYLRYRKQYRAIAEVARQLGWTCGADWSPITITTMLGADPPHYQWDGPLPAIG